MAYKQIRINKTKELEEVLAYLKRRYKALSEAELCKMFLVQAYIDCKKEDTLDLSDISNDELMIQASRVFGIDTDTEPENMADGLTLKPFTIKDAA